MLYTERIKALRSDHDLNQTQVARAIHVAQTTYSDYEKGKVRIPVECLIQLAKFYDVDMNYITGVSDTLRPFHSHTEHARGPAVGREPPFCISRAGQNGETQPGFWYFQGNALRSFEAVFTGWGSGCCRCSGCRASRRSRSASGSERRRR